MPHSVVLYCPNHGCPEHAVDVTLRRSQGRWWADTDHCACGAVLVEEPNPEKVDGGRVCAVEHSGIKVLAAVADALPRDRRVGLSG